MTTDPTTGPQTVSDDYDEAGINYDAVQREIEAMAAVDIIDELRAVLGLSPGQLITEAVTQLRDNLVRLQSQLTEARKQRDQAAEALARAEAERDAAREEHQRLIAQLATVTEERDRWQQLAARWEVIAALVAEIDRLRAALNSQGMSEKGRRPRRCCDG